MRVKIENFGRVSSAKFNLNGITVVAGVNGSGKSTISRVLMTWISYLDQVDDSIAEERVKSVVEQINRILSAADIPRSIFLPSLMFRNLRKLLKVDYWRDRKAVTEWIIRHSIGERGWKLRDDSTDELFSKVDSLFDEIRKEVEEILSTPDEPYEFFVANSFFRRAFDGQVGTFFDVSTDSYVSVEDDGGEMTKAVFKVGKCASLEGVGCGVHVMPAFYIEPRHLIDGYIDKVRYLSSREHFVENRFSRGEGLGWKRILYTNPDTEHWSMQRMEQQEVLNRELDKIVATIHGQIEKSEREIQFRDTDNGEMISIRNIASGAKTMATLIRGLRNGIIESGSLLIIDEPETNLHPEWQVKFAEFLVLLNAKFGIKTLLNTHSPYFLKAVQVYSDLFNISEKCSYYTMEPDVVNGMFHTKDVSECIELVFTEMSRPYAKLIYGERYDSQME